MERSLPHLLKQTKTPAPNAKSTNQPTNAITAALANLDEKGYCCFPISPEALSAALSHRVSLSLSGDTLHTTLQRSGAREGDVFPHSPPLLLNSPVPLSTAAALWTNSKPPRLYAFASDRSCTASHPASAWEWHREVGETLLARLRQGYFCLQLFEGTESVAPVWFGRVSVLCFQMEVSQPSSASCCVHR